VRWCLVNHVKGTWERILGRTPTQVNAKGLLREVHAAEEGLEAGGGTEEVFQLLFCTSAI
jgi:hypothetical protein